MKYLSKLLLLSSMMVLMSPVEAQSRVTISGGNDEFALTPTEVIHYRKQALDGSIDAAAKLSDYYGMVKLDIDQDLYWCLIGAENGNPVAMYNYWVTARLSNDPDVRQRALFWLRKAASLGDQLSQQSLKDLTDKKTK